jgi:serine/threonine-protein kinase
MPEPDDDGGTAATVADRPALLVATLADPPPTARDVIEAPPAATPADALRAEEVDRTRLFIRMGWALSAAAIAGVPLLPAPRAMSALLVAAMVVGIVVSAWFHRAFADPARYTPRALVVLAVMCLVNSHVAVLYYGAFTVAPLIVVIGLHFVARTEAERAARAIYATAVALYAVTALAILGGAIADPGVFASDRALGRGAMLAGALFVVGVYTLAYVTARAFRAASLRAIESLTRATRVASQRAALMEELRLDLARALRPGGPGRHTDQVIGGYKLGAVLGRGAMGEVYDATHVATGAPAAVKLVRRELLGDPAHVARFLREARLGGQLASPHIVAVRDAGDDPPHLAMERLTGQTLAERLRDAGRLALAELAPLVRQIGAGLDAAHAAGIVHRDLKPQNLMLAGVWKILDFGVATGGDATLNGGVVGTPSYMAPEQARGEALDGRADLHALAAVAYRAVTGRQPFAGTHASEAPAILYAVVHRMPPRPGEAVELPDDVDRWFALALAKAPADRFATGAALADGLDAALRSELAPALRRRADALIRALPWG